MESTGRTAAEHVTGTGMEQLAIDRHAASATRQAVTAPASTSQEGTMVATVEVIRADAAIVAFFDASGEWVGAGVVEVKAGGDALIAECQRIARIRGAVVVKKHVEDFKAFAGACRSRVELELPKRPCNGLNVEIGKPMDRCLSRKPGHWPSSMTARRWLLSGGDAYAFGSCRRSGCPELEMEARR